MSNHHIVHIELSALDREASGKFYAGLFGWQVEQMPEMEYATFSTGEGLGGGFNPVREGFPAGTITFYVETDDVDATLAQAEALGGKILSTSMEIPGVGWFGMFADPSGNMVGLLKPLPMSP
jgi:uncharacterized protein